jgi:ABC-2 type transport system permease protein
MSPTWLLTRKDLTQRLRDRSFIILGIVAPFFVAFILSLVAGPAFDQTFEATYVVVDGTGLAGEGLVEGLTDSGIEASLVASEADARTAVDDGAADAAIIIPALDPFGAPTPVSVYGNADGGFALNVAESIAGSVAAGLDQVRLAVAVTGDPAAAAGLGAVEPAVAVQQVGAGDQVLDGTTYLAVGMSIFFLFFSVQGSILNIVEERTNGTLPRLLMAPVGRGSILLGKTMSSAITGLVSMAVLVVATTLTLGADWGPWYGTVVLSAGAVLAAMGLGALIGTFTENAEQASQFAGIVATVFGLLGGVFFQITSGPGFFDLVTRLSPHRWVLDGFGANAGTGSFGEVLADAAVTAAFGIVFGAWAFARRSRLTGVV